MPLPKFLENLRENLKLNRRRLHRREEQRMLQRPLERPLGRRPARPSHREIKRHLDAAVTAEEGGGLPNAAPSGSGVASNDGILLPGEPPDRDFILSQIEVYAFIGPSGTGKSSRAIEIAAALKIDFIIDDGLLIHGGRIVAGSTAKRADTQLQAVRIAIFLEESQALTMRRALADRTPQRLMILGTSDGMIRRIRTQLHLPEPVRVIRIDEVATAAEQRAARERRMRSGHHTIPVPGMEIKHEFSGRLTGSLGRLFRRREPDETTLTEFTDRTVVRPSFSTLGRYSLSEEAMQSLIRFIVSDVPGVAGISDMDVIAHKSGVLIDVALILEYGYNAKETLILSQEQLADKIEQLSGMNVLAVNTMARRLAPARHEVK